MSLVIPDRWTPAHQILFTSITDHEQLTYGHPIYCLYFNALDVLWALYEHACCWLTVRFGYCCLIFPRRALFSHTQLLTGFTALTNGTFALIVSLVLAQVSGVHLTLGQLWCIVFLSLAFFCAAQNMLTRLSRRSIDR